MTFTVDLRNKLCWIPIGFCSWLIIGLFLTFGIAASYGQISTPPQWPSISSTGAYPPTSCIFSMVLVTGSILGFFVILYYYQYLKITKLAISDGYNQALLIMGILVCMGVAMVGCNQRPNIAILHALGAFMAFLIGAAYCAMVTFQTWKTKQQHEDAFPLWFIILRGTLASMEILSVILMFVFSAQRSGNRAAATAGNSFEWAVMGLQSLFLCTFCVEFSNLRFPNLDIDLTPLAKAEYVADRRMEFQAQVRNTAQ